MNVLKTPSRFFRELRKASAGGQLLQPSDVNSSITSVCVLLFGVDEQGEQN